MKDLFNLYEELIDSIEEMINTTMSVMAPYPVDVVGRPNPFPNKKEKKGKEKSAMYKFSYKKNGKIRKSPMTEVVEGNCEKDKIMNIFESLENLKVSKECFNDIMDMVEENILKGSDAELGYLINTPKEEDKAGKEHQKAIENNLKEYFEYVFALMEELLGESNYSAADIANAARKALPARKKEVKQLKKELEQELKNGTDVDSYGVIRAENRLDHAKALASLPKTKKSGISARKLDRAAFNSAIKRGNQFHRATNKKDEKRYEKRWRAAADKVGEYNDRSFNAYMGINNYGDK